MDILLEKKKGIRKKHLPYIAGGAAVVLLLSWIVFGNHAATLRVDARSLSIGDVKRDQFNDFVRVDGQVQPITIVQLSPEEGGIVQELVVEEGARVHRGDVIVRLSNSNLELQILNAEAELAEKQRQVGAQASAPQVTETIVREQPKINRNDKVIIQNIFNGETKEMKYKQALPLLEKGDWVIKR